MNFTQKLQTKSDRIYRIDGKEFHLRKGTVDRLLYFNKSPTSKNNLRMDKNFVDLLLLSIFNVNDLKKKEIDAGLLKIVKCKCENSKTF